MSWVSWPAIGIDRVRIATILALLGWSVVAWSAEGLQVLVCKEQSPIAFMLDEVMHDGCRGAAAFAMLVTLQLGDAQLLPERRVVEIAPQVRLR